MWKINSSYARAGKGSWYPILPCGVGIAGGRKGQGKTTLHFTLSKMVFLQRTYLKPHQPTAILAILHKPVFMVNGIIWRGEELLWILLKTKKVIGRRWQQFKHHSLFIHVKMGHVILKKDFGGQAFGRVIKLPSGAPASHFSVPGFECLLSPSSS